MPITATNNQGFITVQGTALKEAVKKVTTTITALTQTAGGSVAHTDGTLSYGLGALTATHVLTAVELASTGNDDATFSMDMEEQAGQSEFTYVANRKYTISSLMFNAAGALVEQMSLESHTFVAPPSASDLGSVSIGTGSQSITVEAPNANANVDRVIVSVTGKQTSDNDVKIWIKEYSKEDISTGVTITGTGANAGINGTVFTG